MRPALSCRWSGRTDGSRLFESVFRWQVAVRGVAIFGSQNSGVIPPAPPRGPREQWRNRWHSISRSTARRRRSDAPPQTPLLWVIREELKLTGTKFGCGTGLCGACMVHIDGKRAFSCQTQVSAGRRQGGDHHRGPVDQFLPSGAEGLARRAGAAMRLLPVRPDHERRRPAGAQSQARPRRRSSST